jgi:molecular chaperone GrpE
MESETTIPEQPDAEAPAPSAPPSDGEASAEGSPFDQLQKEFEAARTQAAEYLDGWQRARAEFANYKRRVEKDQAETYQNAAGRIIARYLDVMDDFDRAMKDRPGDDDGAAALAQWAEGVQLIYRKLQNLLDAEGVTRIEVEGQEFNPSQHEAVTHEDNSDHPSGHVIAVLRQGYKLGDRVIRPALVRVAK